MNIVGAASNTIHFLQVWREGANAGGVIAGKPALEVRDIIIMKECAIHHFDGGASLVSFF